MGFTNISDLTVIACIEKGTQRVRKYACKEAEHRNLAFTILLKEEVFEDRSCMSDGTVSLPWERIGEKKAMEMASIMELYHSGDETLVEEAKEQIVFRFGKYLMYIIHSYYPTYEAKHTSDLFDAGFIGLMNAMRNYDGSFAFTTYSKNYIIHEMTGYTRYLAGISSPHYARLQKNVQNACKTLESMGKAVTAEAVAKQAGIDVKTAKRELDVIKNANLVYLDDTDDNTETEITSDTGFEDMIVDREMAMSIVREIEKTDETTKQVLLRHIINQETYETIGNLLGLEAKDVKGIYRKGIRTIRKKYTKGRESA